MVGCHVNVLLAVAVAEVTHERGRMHGMSVFGNYGVETVNGISRVIHHTDRAVRLDETVLTLD
jgi:hypothetical protein